MDEKVDEEVMEEEFEEEKEEDIKELEEKKKITGPMVNDA